MAPKKAGTTKPKKVKTIISDNELRAKLQKGDSAKDIMKAFNLESVISLRSRVLKLSIKDDVVYKPSGLYGKGTGEGEVKYQILRDKEKNEVGAFIRISKSKIPTKYQDEKLRFIVKEAETGNGILLKVKEDKKETE
ncbi:MAG: hypothetical protein CVU43_05785 [Chloroflexi bacterium HGW-Chloroflexi-5]|jgi:hypothetical protein|nr:MAG: hypothetical protein CVU43_05785 [Chloroflexi bacterium HGW-Chloroflexi-5]